MKFLKKYMWYIIAAIMVYAIYRILSNKMQSKKLETESLKDVALPIGQLPQTIPFKYNPANVDRKKNFGLGTENSNEVAYLQNWLNLYYQKNLKIDGSFGAKTGAALLTVKPMANQISTNLDTLAI